MRHSGGEPEPPRPPRAHGDAAPGGRRNRGARPTAGLGRRRPRRAAAVVLGLRVHDRRHPDRAAVRRRALCSCLHPPARREETELLVVRHLHLPRHLRLHQPGETVTDLLEPGGNQTHHHHHAVSRSPHFRWDELAVILGLLLATAAGVFIAVRRSRNEPRTRPETVEALAAALDETLDDLRTDPDLRRAIIAAYARMETTLAAAGIPRHPAEAPLEYVERALLSLDASAGAVRRLTELFEWARFSHHEPEPSMRDDAVDALAAVRDELRASELELTPA